MSSLLGTGPDIPEITAFQFQLGPDGRCRLVLLGKGNDPLVVLKLSAADADQLAREMTDRRATYEQRKHEHEGGATH